MRTASLVLASLLTAVPASAAVAGDWAGVLQFPQGSLRLVLHVSGPDEDLHATVDSPDQNASGIPVDSISRTDDKVAFRIDRLAVRFTGTYSGDTIRGTFTQQGLDVPLSLARSTTSGTTTNDDASAISGTWEGTLTFPQQRLRIVLHVSGSGDGLRATADSPDQNVSGIPVDSITVQGNVVRFTMSAVNARFQGTAADETIRGTFNQNGLDVPLTLRRQ
jgi:hypothetical protein